MYKIFFVQIKVQGYWRLQKYMVLAWILTIKQFSYMHLAVEIQLTNLKALFSKSV
jgi:hypothetical protein